MKKPETVCWVTRAMKNGIIVCKKTRNLLTQTLKSFGFEGSDCYNAGSLKNDCFIDGSLKKTLFGRCWFLNLPPGFYWKLPEITWLVLEGTWFCLDFASSHSGGSRQFIQDQRHMWRRVLPICKRFDETINLLRPLILSIVSHYHLEPRTHKLFVLLYWRYFRGTKNGHILSQ